MPLTELPRTLPYEVDHDFLWIFAEWEHNLRHLAQMPNPLPSQAAELQKLRSGYPPRAWVHRLRHDELLRLIRCPAAIDHSLLASIGILEFAQRYEKGSLRAEQVPEVRRIWGETERALYNRHNPADVKLILNENELDAMAKLTGRV